VGRVTAYSHLLNQKLSPIGSTFSMLSPIGATDVRTIGYTI
jgi:hypothetical protein